MATEPTQATVEDGWLDGLDEDLAAALGELSEGERRAVELRVLEERDYADVARQLGSSEGAARVRVSRALGRMKRRLTTATTGADR